MHTYIYISINTGKYIYIYIYQPPIESILGIRQTKYCTSIELLAKARSEPGPGYQRLLSSPGG